MLDANVPVAVEEVRLTKDLHSGVILVAAEAYEMHCSLHHMPIISSYGWKGNRFFQKNW